MIVIMFSRATSHESRVMTMEHHVRDDQFINAVCDILFAELVKRMKYHSLRACCG